MQDFPALGAIQEAANRTGPHIHRTRVLTCGTINEMIGAEIYFKCKNFQKTGAFKFRGGTNAVFSLGAPTRRAREETLAKLISETGATSIHPYNDFRIVAGQAIVALEFLEDISGERGEHNRGDQP